MVQQLTFRKGAVKVCFGFNFYYILMTNGEIARVNEPTLEKDKTYKSKAMEQDVTKVSTDTDSCIIDIDCGHSYALFLTSQFGVISTGIAQQGALGLGPNTTVLTKPQKIQMPLSNLKILSIVAGPSHCAAITVSRKALTWGFGGDGRLGHGTSESVFFPTFVASLENSDITKVTCGYLLSEKKRLHVVPDRPGRRHGLWKYLTGQAGYPQRRRSLDRYPHLGGQEEPKVYKHARAPRRRRALGGAATRAEAVRVRRRAATRDRLHLRRQHQRGTLPSTSN